LYEERLYQKETEEFIINSLKNNYGVAIEAPTGSGKTLMSLRAALRLKTGKSMKILYLVRTNSQEEQIINELRNLKDEFKIKAVPMQGRLNLCPLYKISENQSEFNADSIARFCNYKKKQVMSGKKDACKYYNMKIRSEDMHSYIYEKLPTAEEFYEYSVMNNVCPYETLKSALYDADVAVAPYAYFLNRNVADRFLSHWGVARQDLIIILDESHNLPDIARNAGSFKITMESLNRADKEAQDYGDQLLTRNMHANEFIEMIRSTITALIRDFVKEEDSRIKFSDFSEYFMIENKKSEKDLRELTNYLRMFGEYIENAKEEEEKVPFSSVLTLASRLMTWADTDEEKYAAILSKERNGYMEAICLDPSDVLSILKESKTIHMSGTLAPFNAYEDMTGFRIPFKSVGEVFPKENRFVAYYDRVTTKYNTLNEDEVKKISDIILKIVSTIRKNAIVYFPSYSLLERVNSYIDMPDILREKKNIGQENFMDMVREFRSGGRLMFSVAGGRASEGMNFPGNQLELIIIVGIPYPKPDAANKALFDYYERRYSAGWEYSVTIPAVVKIRQEIGRLIRSSRDIGAAVILDKRARNLKRFIPDIVSTSDPAADLKKFFESKSPAINDFRINDL